MPRQHWESHLHEFLQIFPAQRIICRWKGHIWIKKFKDLSQRRRIAKNLTKQFSNKTLHLLFYSILFFPLSSSETDHFYTDNLPVFEIIQIDTKQGFLDNHYNKHIKFWQLQFVAAVSISSDFSHTELCIWGAKCQIES